MDIPIHYRVALIDRGGYESHERGGPIKEVRLEVPTERRFPTKFGKRIKALGGSYDTCRGRYHYLRTVRFEWNWEGPSEKLLEDILRFFESTGEKQDSIVVLFITDNGDFGTYTDRVDMTARDLVEEVREKVYSNCSRDDRTEVYRTCEEAEGFIAWMTREKEERERKQAEAKAVEKELLEAFDEAGFPCSSSHALYFDVKTSRRLIEFLKGVHHG